MGSGTYTDREQELIEEGYDPCQAIQIAQDEKGADEFYKDMSESSSDWDD